MNLQIRITPVPPLSDVVDALGGNLGDYDWHLADIESIPRREQIGAGWIKGAALADALRLEQVHFMWGVFDAFPKGFRCPVSDEPWADGNAELWEEGVRPQMLDALFEIVYWDSTVVLLLGITPEQTASVTMAFGAANVSPSGA